MVKSRLLITVTATFLLVSLGLTERGSAQYTEHKLQTSSPLSGETAYPPSDFGPAYTDDFGEDEYTAEEKQSVDLDDFHYVPPAESKSTRSGLVHSIRSKPGIALLSSAVIPGSGQLINQKYLRGALYLAAEATALILHISKNSKANRQHDRYHDFANTNWSVVNYANWLVDYYQNNDQLTGGADLEKLKANLENNNVYDLARDASPYGKEAWSEVDLGVLNRVERQTPYDYDGSGNNFSHTLPEYGSQQYYELISKYYQFGPGWNDFGQTRDGDQLESLYQLSWGKPAMPPNWHEGARRAARFNNNYKLANNMFKLMVVNHVISAFDAYFTVKIKQHKLKADATLLRGGGSLVTLNYGF